MRKQNGFSLIELLIVIAIILIIAGIAIPNLLRSRMAANEASAVSAMRSINTAQIAYNSTYPSIGYASALATLGPPSGDGSCASAGSATSTNACLLDQVLQTGTKAGYTFVISNLTGSPAVTYQTNGNPFNPGTTGQRWFYSDASGVIRFNEDSTASLSDPPIQ